MAKKRLGAGGAVANAGVIALSSGRAMVAPLPLMKDLRFKEVLVAM